MASGIATAPSEHQLSAETQTFAPGSPCTCPLGCAQQAGRARRGRSGQTGCPSRPPAAEWRGHQSELSTPRGPLRQDVGPAVRPAGDQRAQYQHLIDRGNTAKSRRMLRDGPASPASPARLCRRPLITTRAWFPRATCSHAQLAAAVAAGLPTPGLSPSPASRHPATRMENSARQQADVPNTSNRR